MAKSLIIFGLLVAVGGGAYYVLSGADSSQDKPSIVENLESRNSQSKADVQAPKKAASENRPVASKTGPWPKFVADDRTHFFGRMELNDEKTHVFKISNQGEADLELTAGETTCKCTKFGFDTPDSGPQKAATVKPGESITLTISWKGGGAPNRSFNHGGDVFSNDPEVPLLKFGVEGSVETAFDVLPQIWNFGNIHEGEEGKFKGVIASRLFEDLTIESIESPSGMVKATWQPLSVEEKARDQHLSGSKITLELSGEMKVGVFEELLTIKLAQQKDPIKVSVSARKHGVLRLQQMAGTNFDADNLLMQLGSFPASEGRDAKMLLIVDEKSMTEPFKITESVADPIFLKAKIEQLGEPSGTVHRYLLTISAPPGRPHTQRVIAKPGFIKLSTNHPSGEMIHFQVLMYSN